MGGLFSSFGAGQVKVEAGKDGSSVYFDWVNGVYEPLMQALESVTNHLHEATNDSFVFTAVGLRVTWGILGPNPPVSTSGSTPATTLT